MSRLLDALFVIFGVALSIFFIVGIWLTWNDPTACWTSC